MERMSENFKYVWLGLRGAYFGHLECRISRPIPASATWPSELPTRWVASRESRAYFSRSGPTRWRWPHRGRSDYQGLEYRAVSDTIRLVSDIERSVVDPE